MSLTGDARQTNDCRCSRFRNMTAFARNLVADELRKPGDGLRAACRTRRKSSHSTFRLGTSGLGLWGRVDTPEIQARDGAERTDRQTPFRPIIRSEILHLRAARDRLRFT